MRISLDFETRSPVDLKKCGAHVYFQHPETEVLMAAYRIDGGPLKIWTFDQLPPDDLLDAIEDGAKISAWNANFEALGLDMLARRRGWPFPRPGQFVDTMAATAAMSLPRALGDAALALGLDIQKDKEGMRLIRKFSMPRRPRVMEDPEGLFWNEPQDHPEDWEKFKAYCMRDVEVEEAISARIVPLSAAEQAVWDLDFTINRRGVRIDRTSALAAIRMAEKAKKKLDAEIRAVTGGYVGKCSEPGKLVEWIKSQGVEIGSAAKAEITELLALDDLPERVTKALEIRQEAAKTSVSKLSAMLDRASADGRVRGTFLYHGASTGRWSSVGVNFANLPRPRKDYEKALETGAMKTIDLFADFQSEDPDLLKAKYGPALGRPLHLISDAIRGFIWSAPGHDLVQADYSGIEGAVIAFLADEQWKLKAMFDILADPSIPDMYRQTAAGIMNMSTDVIDKKHPLRQSVGKVSELALGFGGGVAAFYAMAKGYGVKLDQLFGPVWESADEERRAKAVKRYASCLQRGTNRTTEMSREAWIACELIKVGWRATNPAISGCWRALEGAIRNAIENPGQQFTAAKCTYLVANGFLWCRLPSGRCLAYGAPRLKDQVWAEVKLDDGSWSDAEVMDKEEAEARELKGTVRIQGKTSPKATALGVNSVTKKWERFGLYGGLAAENVTQATARDLLVNGMWKAEEAGYPVIAHVYDELICEVPRGFGDIKAFERLICELPEWAQGLPLTASGWAGKRYRKD